MRAQRGGVGANGRRLEDHGVRGRPVAVLAVLADARLCYGRFGRAQASCPPLRPAQLPRS